MNEREQKKYQRGCYNEKNCFKYKGIHYRMQDIMEDDIWEETRDGDFLNEYICYTDNVEENNLFD